jgi:hypothetical protein
MQDNTLITAVIVTENFCNQLSINIQSEVLSEEADFGDLTTLTNVAKLFNILPESLPQYLLDNTPQEVLLALMIKVEQLDLETKQKLYTFMLSLLLSMAKMLYKSGKLSETLTNN